jgi:hypothetical protein
MGKFGWSLPPGVSLNDIDPVTEEAELKEGQLRVWHIPQVPMAAFRVDVASVEEAKKVLSILADYDIFQFENKVKPDYANASGLETVENGEWREWWSEDGGDIWELIRESVPPPALP